MRYLRGYERSAIGLALVGTTMAGCAGAPSSPNQIPTRAESSAPSPSFAGPTATIASCGPESGRQSAGGSMKYTYEYTTDASKPLATLQQEIGVAAVSLAIHHPFIIRIGGVACTVRLGIPKNIEARQQAVVFAGNSNEAPAIYSQLGIPGQTGDTTSTTYYQVSESAHGSLEESGPSISVIGQETTGPGTFQNAGTEFCQGLEVDDPSTTSTTLYAVEKEAVCNALGIGADSRQLGMTYTQYKQRLQQGGDILTGPASHGLDVQLPELTTNEYDALPSVA